MGRFGNWFKIQPQTEEECKNSAAIMKRLKTYHGKETGKWLRLMRDPSQIPTSGLAPTIEDVDKQEVDILGEGTYTAPIESLSMTEPYLVPDNAAARSLVNSEMLKWVNALFTEFAVQASLYNSTASATHLFVTVQAPDFAWLPLKASDCSLEKKIAGFKAHLATRQWALLVQGSPEMIEIYVVPAAVILDFTLHGICDSRYAPVITIDTSDVESKKIWRISGSDITFDSIPLLAEKLLGYLVRTSTGSMIDAELLAANKSRVKPEETIAKGISTEPSAQTDLGTGSSPSSSTSSAASSSLDPSIERMHTWTASNQLLQAISDDMPWLTELKGDINSANESAGSARLEDLITRLRTISGQISGLVATYHPPEGSKYNAS